MESRFDMLAKALAGATTGVSRREALRRLGGTMAGAALAAFGIGCADEGAVGPDGRPSLDARGRCKKVGQKCRTDTECCSNRCFQITGTCACPAGTFECSFSGQCIGCTPGTTFNPTTCQCEVGTCPTGTILCGSTCCASTLCCSGVCCQTGQTCVNGACSSCPTGQTQCGTAGCCDTAQCCNGVCCPSGQACVGGVCTTTTCPTGQTPCGTTCCPTGSTCDAANSVCTCGTGQTECGPTCCAAGQLCNFLTGTCEPATACLTGTMSCTTSTGATVCCLQAAPGSGFTTQCGGTLGCQLCETATGTCTDFAACPVGTAPCPTNTNVVCCKSGEICDLSGAGGGCLPA